MAASPKSLSSYLAFPYMAWPLASDSTWHRTDISLAAGQAEGFLKCTVWEKVCNKLDGWRPIFDGPFFKHLLSFPSEAAEEVSLNEDKLSFSGAHLGLSSREPS